MGQGYSRMTYETGVEVVEERESTSASRRLGKNRGQLPPGRQGPPPVPRPPSPCILRIKKQTSPQDCE
jgi:hypothetical protein